ncbi:MAG: hypothetical protein AAEJ04_09145 [Planctomycetota bacterium]
MSQISTAKKAQNQLPLFLGLLLLAGSTGAISTDGPLLDETTFQKWRDYIEPTKKEQSWEEIPWRGRFLEAIEEASEKKLPVLLWAMNGHPLGCT